MGVNKRAAFLYWLFAATVFGVAVTGCKSEEVIETKLPTSITVYENKFVDNYGRHVILNGINVISKSKERG